MFVPNRPHLQANQRLEVPRRRKGASKCHNAHQGAATVELQWFIQEQVEEEHTFRAIVSKLNLIKDDPSALLDLDRELGRRQTA